MNFFFKTSFFMWTIFKVFIEFVTVCFSLMFCVFDQKACGILAPRQGIKPAPPALEAEAFPGSPGKSQRLLAIYP